MNNHKKISVRMRLLLLIIVLLKNEKWILFLEDIGSDKGFSKLFLSKIDLLKEINDVKVIDIELAAIFKNRDIKREILKNKEYNF